MRARRKAFNRLKRLRNRHRFVDRGRSE